MANQYVSRKRTLLALLNDARDCLALGGVEVARCYLAEYWAAYARVPASTRRRWKCGY